MKVIVTGAEGMLGSDLCDVFQNSGIEAIGFSRNQLDICELDKVKQIITSEKPHCVIHTAAITNVDECQKNQALAHSVNTVGTWNVALACKKADAILVYISSCGVFDGTKGEPYREIDQPAPRTHYHQSKYLGEQIVSQLCQDYFIVRPGWLFGGKASHRRNFVEARRKEAIANPKMVSAKDKFGSPTYTADLAKQLVDLIQSEAFGLYHVANVGFASRYEYVNKIVQLLDLKTEVSPVGSDAFVRPAPVPAWEALDNFYLKLRNLLQMRSWEDSLEDYIKNRLLLEVN
ncbi:MAG: dTDP-4-dehydrorhamnose reductase [Phormidium sp.]